jgi:hypothetical protein
MRETVARPLPTGPFRTAKVKRLRGESGLQKLNPAAGAVLDAARSAARLEPKQMAADMAISHSLVLRGLKSADHLSFHRLWELPDAFWRELLVAIADTRGIGFVRRSIALSDERRPR